jgi:hypothetical protein
MIYHRLEDQSALISVLLVNKIGAGRWRAVAEGHIEPSPGKFYLFRSSSAHVRDGIMAS